jgi:hypothetical protein
MPRDLYAPTLLLPLLAHVLCHALRLLLSDGQDHELHANREGVKDKPSPPAVFLFFDCGRQGASEVMDEIGDVQSIECPDLVETKTTFFFILLLNPTTTSKMEQREVRTSDKYSSSETDIFLTLIKYIYIILFIIYT